MKYSGDLRPTSCCGLTEFHNLREVYPFDSNYRVEISKQAFRKTGHAYFATTAMDQKAEAKALKKAGFRSIGTWRNSNTGRKLTMWVKNIRRI